MITRNKTTHSSEETNWSGITGNGWKDEKSCDDKARRDFADLAQVYTVNWDTNEKTTTEGKYLEAGTESFKPHSVRIFHREARVGSFRRRKRGWFGF